MRNKMRMAGMAAVIVLAMGSARGDLDVGKLTGIYTDPACAAREKQAAATLAGKLNAMYAVKLAVNPTNTAYAPTLENAIFVGRKAALDSGLITADEMAKVKEDGFVVRVKGNRMAIGAIFDRGSIYGVYGFLETLGYRYFADGFETVPKQTNKQIKDMVISDKPAMPFRTGNVWQLRESVDSIGDPRKGANPELFGADSKLWIDHTSGYLVPRKLYFAEHPEYFSMQLNGTRNPTITNDAYVHLCLSNPDVQRISIERALAWIRNEPDKRFFCITQGDGLDWCQCEKCKAMDVEPGNYSDRLMKWVNPIARAVAKEFPDAIILAAAYCGTELAPVKEKPEKNVWVMYAPYWGNALSMAHPLTHESNTEALRQFETWRKVAPDNLAVYDYNLYYVPSWDAMAEKVQWYAKQGVKGIWNCGRPSCFHELFIYMETKLEWNPALDPEQLKKEFVEAVYGPAAPAVKEYLALVRERLQKGYPKGIHEGSMPAAYYEAPVLKRMLACFDKAAVAAGTNAALQGMIRNERGMMMGDYRAAVTLKTAGLKAEDCELALKLYHDFFAQQKTKYDELSKAFAQEGLDAKKKESLQKERDDFVSGLRSSLNYFAGMDIPKDVDPLPVAELFIKDVEGTRAKYPVKSVKTEAEKIAGGIRLPATAFEGGFGPEINSWFCAPKMSMTAYTPRSPRPSRMKAEFALDEAPKGPAVLDIEAQDSDKDSPPPAQIEIKLNGKIIFSGDSAFAKRGWSRRQFPVEAGILQKGKNVLEIRNTYMESKRLDHYWFCLSEAVIRFK